MRYAIGFESDLYDYRLFYLRTKQFILLLTKIKKYILVNKNLIRLSITKFPFFLNY